MKEEKYEQWSLGRCFKCSKCSLRKSILSESVFERNKTSVQRLFGFFYLFWAQKDDFAFVERELGFSLDTINWQRKFCRNTILDFYVRFVAKKIGAPGHIVHLDATLLCKRKYRKGRRLIKEQFWIVGGIDLTSQRKRLSW